MNAIIERAMNSKNLGAGITRNGALDQKIWFLEAFRGKTVFFRRFWGNSNFFWSGWRVLAQKIGALAKFGDFSVIFMEFWRV
jgi:hypothetical protein